MGAETPEEILARDAAEWKRRVLKAEAQNRTLGVLRGLANIAFRAWLEEAEPEQVLFGKRYPDLAAALDDLWEVLAHVDELDPPHDFFSQRTSGLTCPLEIRERKALGSVSTLALSDGTPGSANVVEVDADLPTAAKAIGVLFQLVQLADLAALKEGAEDAMVSPRWIQDRAPALLVLLAATRFLHPALPVTVADVAALST